MNGMGFDLRGKNTLGVYGRDYPTIVSEAYRQNVEVEILDTDGVSANERSRPPKGSFSLIEDEDIVRMLDVLKVIGLRKFEDMIPIDFYTKPVKIDPRDHLEQGGVKSELYFRLPVNPKDKVGVIFRVLVTYPYFINENGEKITLTELPEWYRKGVMSNFNASAIEKIIGSKLPERFKLSFKKLDFFRKIFARAMKKSEKEPIPIDIGILKKCMAFGLLHEFTHALVLHMPDEPSINAMKQDDPEWVKKYPNQTEREIAFAKEQERLRSFSFNAYKKLVLESEELQRSAVYVKNLNKAQKEVMGKKIDPSNETEEAIDRLLTIEMICDRFGIYMYEIYRKLQIYHEALPDLGKPFPFDVMKKLESMRMGNHSSEFVLKLEKYDFNVKDSALLNKLLQDLQNAESEHFYLQDMHEPILLPEERKIFSNLLDLLRYFDEEKNILAFPSDHLQSQSFKDIIKTARIIPQEMTIAVGPQEIALDGEAKIISEHIDIDDTEEEIGQDILEAEQREIEEEELKEQMEQLAKSFKNSDTEEDLDPLKDFVNPIASPENEKNELP
jgi:hypothetical protein